MANLPAAPSTPAVPGSSIAVSDSSQRNFTDGSFKDYRFHIATPTFATPHGVRSITKVDNRRLQKIKRPLTEGDDVHDFGRDARTFSAEIVFFGPNYLNEFYSFRAKCDEGTAGKLILPDQPEAILAMYSNMSVASNASDGESLTISVMWIEAASYAVSDPFECHYRLRRFPT